MNPSESFFIGVDVGTGSARRGCFFDAKGRMLVSALEPIQMWKPPGRLRRTVFADDIWESVGNVVRRAVQQRTSVRRGRRPRFRRHLFLGGVRRPRANRLVRGAPVAPQRSHLPPRLDRISGVTARGADRPGSNGRQYAVLQTYAARSPPRWNPQVALELKRIYRTLGTNPPTFSI